MKKTLLFMPVRANPMIPTFKNQFRWTSIAIIVPLIELAAFLFSVFMHLNFNPGKVAHILSLEFPMVGAWILILYSALLGYWRWRYWQRIEERHFAAIWGDLSLLATEQSVPADVPVSHLPITLTLRYSMTSLLWMVGVAWICVAVYALLMTWWMSSCWSGNLITVDPLFMIVVLAVAVFLMALPIFMIHSQKHVVEVSEQGITMHSRGEVDFVRWQEARLFAVYPTWEVQRSQSSLTYELSSATGIVRWTCIIRHPATAILQMVPTTPLQEYSRQVQALNALVSARTGLPLADLR